LQPVIRPGDVAAIGNDSNYIGCSVVHELTGLRFVALSPRTHPALWQEYIELAVARYAEYGVSDVIDDAMRAGTEVAVFWMAFDGDRPVAGARALAVRSADDVRSLHQMQGHPRFNDMRDCLASAIADGGLLEGGTAWRSSDAPRGTSAALARFCLASTFVMGYRWCVGTAAQHGFGMWTEAGCEPIDYGIAATWPTPEHQTRLLLMDSKHLSAELRADYDLIIQRHHGCGRSSRGPQRSTSTT